MKKKHYKIGAPFVPHTFKMLRSPTWRVLSLTAHRILSRIEIEFGNHGGRDNGKLPVTFADFEKYGIERHAIGPGLREVSALGLHELTRQGRAGNREFRTPNLHRLTYLPASGKTANKRMACDRNYRRGRADRSQSASYDQKPPPKKTENQCGKTHRDRWGKPTGFRCGKTHRPARIFGAGKPTTI
jgi:hypothetical protein